MKFTQEQEEIYQMLIEEAERDIEKNGTMSWEEFCQKLERIERREGLYDKKIKYNKKIQLKLMKCFGKISKKFVRV